MKTTTLNREEIDNSVIIDLTGLARLRWMKDPSKSREARDVRKQMREYNSPQIKRWYSIYLPCPCMIKRIAAIKLEDLRRYSRPVVSTEDLIA